MLLAGSPHTSQGTIGWLFLARIWILLPFLYTSCSEITLTFNYHFNAYQDEYVAFCVTLTGCIDGLDTCFACEEDNQEIRMRVIRTLFAIYRFYTDSRMDLDEDIPSLLIGNMAPEERQVIAGWVRDALAKAKRAKWSSSSPQQRYSIFLLALEKDKKDHE